MSPVTTTTSMFCTSRQASSIRRRESRALTPWPLGPSTRSRWVSDTCRIRMPATLQGPSCGIGISRWSRRAPLRRSPQRSCVAETYKTSPADWCTVGRVNVDLSAAAAFMAGHARVLDRRRFQLLMGDAYPSAVLAALDAYRNPDGGYGWALEADLRSTESQPGAALHAFEVLEELAPATAPQALALC